MQCQKLGNSRKQRADIKFADQHEAARAEALASVGRSLHFLSLYYFVLSFYRQYGMLPRLMQSSSLCHASG